MVFSIKTKLRALTMLLTCTSFLPWFVSCGTEVNVGRNSDPAYFDSGDDFLSGDGSQDGGSIGSGDAMALSCFGAAEESALPESIVDFCANTSEDIQANYQKIFNTICKERRLANLVNPQCGWDGEQELGSYLRVLERTDLDDTGIKEFDFYAAGSVRLPRTVDEYLWGFYEGYENPEFRARLKVYDKVNLSNLAVDKEAGAIDYTVEIKTSAATVGFTGRVDVVRYDSGLVAVFDRAVKDFKIVKENRFVTLVAPTGENEIVVVIIDQKKVDDMGNHRIAYSSAIGFDKERMELMHAMAVYNEQADL